VHRLLEGARRRRRSPAQDPGMTGSRNFERTPGLAQLARRQHAVVTRAQLAGVGISARHVASQLAARRWRAVTSDVVVLHTGPLPREAELWVAVLDAEPPVALGSWTGLARHGLRGWDREGTHIVVPRGAKTRRLPGVVVHESRRPAPEDIVRVDRLPVHTAQRCAVDAAAWQESPRTAVGLLAAVVQQRKASASPTSGVGQMPSARSTSSGCAVETACPSPSARNIGSMPGEGTASSTPNGFSTTGDGSWWRSTGSDTWTRPAGTTISCGMPSWTTATARSTSVYRRPRQGPNPNASSRSSPATSDPPDMSDPHVTRVTRGSDTS
jgi:hypothetical protein